MFVAIHLTAAEAANFIQNQLIESSEVDSVRDSIAALGIVELYQGDGIGNPLAIVSLRLAAGPARRGTALDRFVTGHFVSYLREPDPRLERFAVVSAIRALTGLGAAVTKGQVRFLPVEEPVGLSRETLTGPTHSEVVDWFQVG
jgi:hypothetical protein